MCKDDDGEYPQLPRLCRPYGLGYVPGPWMQSIQVSKGSSSVKNGYEAITGQINVEFKKPQLPEADWFSANLCQQHQPLRSQCRCHGETLQTLSTSLLAHYENETKAHDSNDDGFADIPAWSSTTSGTAGHTWATATSSRQASKCLRKTATAASQPWQNVPGRPL